MGLEVPLWTMEKSTLIGKRMKNYDQSGITPPASSYRLARESNGAPCETNCEGCQRILSQLTL
jgi:hypothetical protein